MSVVEGSGACVYDEGNKYLDFTTLLYCANPDFDNEPIISAMEEQLRRIPYVSSTKGNDVRDRFAERLVAIVPDSLSDAFFALLGSEANEAAFQMAREHQDAPKVLTRWNSYHGSTCGAASLTGEPIIRITVERYASTMGEVKFLPPLSYRSPFNAASPGELAERAADRLELVIRNEGPNSIAALHTELIGGTSGAFTAGLDISPASGNSVTSTRSSSSRTR